MNRIERFRLLAIFADNKAHSCFEIINFGAVLLNKTQRRVEKVFKRELLENGLVYRCGKSGLFHTDNFQISSKGDEAFRVMQIDFYSRTKLTDDIYHYYKYFDRDTQSKIGESKISEKDLRQSSFIPTFGNK